MAPKKALILSGGGGRGAYHIGVLKELVRQGWIEDGKGPDIIAGTSIGAINAAALASGLTVAQLERNWLDMLTEDVHRLSADLPLVARPAMNLLLRSVLTSDEGGFRFLMPSGEEPSLRDRLGGLLQPRPFRSLLDTKPWRKTLDKWMDFERINGPDAPALLLAATELQTGTLQVFCNRKLPHRPADTITIDHLMASSSIPIIYPWTEIGEAKYWDGAVLANTPLEPVIQLAGEEEIDIVVVMMTPWYADVEEMREQAGHMPQDLAQALSLTLDWALLASYRVAFEMLETRNQLAKAQARLDALADKLGDESLRMSGPRVRQVLPPTVVSPTEMMPLDWIIDYEQANHRTLFIQGQADAARAFACRKR